MTNYYYFLITKETAFVKSDANKLLLSLSIQVYAHAVFASLMYFANFEDLTIKAMRHKPTKEIVQYFFLMNGVEKLIVFSIATIGVGIAVYAQNKESSSILGLIGIEVLVLLGGTAIYALFFYIGYSEYKGFVNGARINVVGWNDFIKSFDTSFWNGDFDANVNFRVEAKNSQPDLNKSISEFLQRVHEASRNKHSLGNFTVSKMVIKGTITVGASSNFLIKEFIYNLTVLHERFPSCGLTLYVSASGGQRVGQGREESADETWAEARYREAMERHSHDNDFGGDHSHRH